MLFFNLKASDKGVGVLFLTNSLPTSLISSRDSIELYDSDLELKIGAFIFDTSVENRFKLIHTDLQKSYLIEFAYETIGIPIDEVVSKSIIKVILGSDRLNNPIYAWVHFNSESMDYYCWTYLLCRRVLFISSESVEFYNKPFGERVNIEMPGATGKANNDMDFVMYPLEILGNWMKVEIVTPNDHCEENIHAKHYIRWINFLDKRGRPLVWYYPRGC
jgi:hypothetical protein